MTAAKRLSRYAPTIVVGLGGSGAATLRSLKRRVFSDDPDAPVIMLGIDLDRSEFTNPESALDLSVASQQFFDPKPIETYLLHLNRNRGDDALDFEYLRRWLTVEDGRQVRNAQVSRAGAKQFRPLGRLGFFHYAREIQEAIRNARAQLDDHQNRRVLSGLTPMIYVVTSLAGGTGSGMLFDAAALLRTEMPDLPIVLIGLLPDVFGMHNNIDNIYANTYASLEELAHLKNQHILFDAQYKGVLTISKAQSLVLFDRIFLCGGWLGQTRPFDDSKEVFPYLADILRMLMIGEMRKSAIRYQANAGGDTRRLLSDPFSKHVFGEVAAAGIRLMSWSELGLQVLQMVVEGLPKSGSGLAALSPRIADGDVGDDVRRHIDQAEADLSVAKLQAVAQQKLDALNYRALRLEDKERFLAAIRELVAGEPAIAISARSTTSARPALPHIVLVEDGSIVGKEVNKVLTDIAGILSEIAGRSRLPGELDGLLQNIKNAIGTPERPPLYPRDLKLNYVAESVTEDTPFKGVFAVRSLERNAAKTANLVLKNIENDLSYYQTVFRHRVGSALRRLVDDYRIHDASRWTHLDGFQQDVAARFKRKNALGTYNDGLTAVDPSKVDVFDKAADSVRGEVRYRSIYLDCSRALTPNEVFEKQVTTPAARAIADRLVQRIASTHGEYRNEANADVRARIIDELLEYASSLFSNELATEVGNGTPSRFLDPHSFFKEEEIRKLIERCATPLFKEGTVPPTILSTDARVLVAGKFPGSDDFVNKLVDTCRGVLHARVERVISEDDRDDGRIAIVVEKLFRAASDLEGIHRYYDFYRQSPAPQLHHVDKRWLAELKPLVAEGAAMGRVPCGNVDCEGDLRDVDRETIFCPSCGEPIRSRCGNRGCAIDDLHERANLAALIEKRFCPGCDKFLRTYWWKCERHGAVPMDKITCPTCVRDRLSLDDGSHRPDFRARFFCPSCRKQGHNPPFTVTGVMTRWLTHGVNGHEVSPARERFAEILKEGKCCPTCGVQLAPYCPYDHPYRPSYPHFLFRDPAAGSHARFRCYLHVDKVFYTCSVCEYAVPSGSTRCGRCGTDLRSCRFCTKTFYRLVPARDDHGEVQRCGNCGTWPDDLDPAQSRKESARDRFCSNIYGCPAGAHLTEATFPPGTQRCPVCEAAEPRLLDVESREDHLGACALCWEVFIGGAPTERRHATSDPPANCCLCGRRIADVERLRDTVEWKSTVLISRALVSESDNRDAFSFIRRDMVRREDIPRKLVQFVQSIFRSDVRAMCEPRIERLLSFWEGQYGCRDIPKKSSYVPGPSHEADANGASPSANHSTETVRDPEFILAHEDDVRGWVRLLRQHGYEREHLINLRSSILDLAKNEHQRKRVATIIDRGLDVWDSVEDL